MSFGRSLRFGRSLLFGRSLRFGRCLRFGRSLRFCYLELKKEAISDVVWTFFTVLVPRI